MTDTFTTTTLGKTSLGITGVGLGAWAIGGGGWQGGWGDQDDEESIATIHAAVAAGLNWIDTAPAYGFGRAESVVGEALRRLPAGDRPYVFTKCGLVWEHGVAGFSNVLRPESIRQECETSLRRLGVDTIDLYQVHWPSEDGTPVEESWATMASLVDEGKVRFIGVSNFDLELLERCQAVRQIDTFQPELSLLVRQAVSTTIPWCRDQGTGVIVYSPMRSGLLTGRFSAERVRSLAHDDWRSDHDDFREPALSRNLALVSRLEALADRLGCTLPALAVAWTLAWPGVDGAIVGARRPDQLSDWIGCTSIRLDHEHLAEIAAAIAETGAGSGPVGPLAT